MAPHLTVVVSQPRRCALHQFARALCSSSRCQLEQLILNDTKLLDRVFIQQSHAPVRTCFRRKGAASGRTPGPHNLLSEVTDDFAEAAQQKQERQEETYGLRSFSKLFDVFGTASLGILDSCLNLLDKLLRSPQGFLSSVGGCLAFLETLLHAFSFGFLHTLAHLILCWKLLVPPLELLIGVGQLCTNLPLLFHLRAHSSGPVTNHLQQTGLR
mmetsp:Transcript_15711/g.37319  ORF Transcript_15711/g.37319 Transcript_15711/m.37319 type:complete len:213 (+) Transcript_15711:146-784(+)